MAEHTGNAGVSDSNRTPVTYDVSHVDMINDHPVVAILSKCQIDIGRKYGAHQISMHWEQSAVFVKVGETIVAAMSYKHEKHMKQTWIFLAYVEPEFRRSGMYHAMFEEVKLRSQKEGMKSIAGGIATNNNAMIAAAESVGRKAEFTCYRIDL